MTGENRENALIGALITFMMVALVVAAFVIGQLRRQVDDLSRRANTLQAQVNTMAAETGTAIEAVARRP